MAVRTFRAGRAQEISGGLYRKYAADRTDSAWSLFLSRDDFARSSENSRAARIAHLPVEGAGNCAAQSSFAGLLASRSAKQGGTAGAAISSRSDEVIIRSD